MELSSKTVEALVEIITGDKESYPYRSGPDLVNFFNQFGYDDRYGPRFPSRTRYTEAKLYELNSTAQMGEVVEKALDPRHFHSSEADIEDVAERMQLCLEYDGYDITKVGKHYEVVDSSEVIEADTELEQLDEIDHDFVEEQIQKCKRKIEEGDFDGAITNARSMVEAVLIGIEQDLAEQPEEHKGDLSSLYKRVYRLLNLDPSAEDLDTNLRQILSGLISVVDGLGGLRNRMSDSHATSYRAHRHHAKLAVNTANTFADFLVESYLYQKERGKI